MSIFSIVLLASRACHRVLSALGLPSRPISLLDSLLGDLHQHTVKALFHNVKRGKLTPRLGLQ